MAKKRIFTHETKKELMGWLISGVVLMAEYVFYTRFRDLSPSSILMVEVYRPSGYSPPSIIESSGLFLLFLLMMVTGGVFIWFSKRLIVKFCHWILG